MVTESGTRENPWKLKTPPGTSDYEVYKDEKDGKEILVCTVGETVLTYDYRAIADLHKMLKAYGGWMELGSADEQKPKRESGSQSVKNATLIFGIAPCYSVLYCVSPRHACRLS